MAAFWERSLTPWIDENGDPYSGAKAYFFANNTTTPIVTYTDAALSIPNDHPVVANSGGMFPPVYLPEQILYRLRITTADNVTIWDVDNIPVPTTTPIDIPTSDTPPQQLFRTGDIKMAWRTTIPSGFVRLNGRSIGGASSGATERANADCEDLFKFLWDEDPDLTVSGGRGVSAAGDWAAAKNIALPDWRGRAPIGPDSFGASAANRITDAQLGADSDTLGKAGGAAAVVLTEAQLAAHDHTASSAEAGTHKHLQGTGEINDTSFIKYGGANINMNRRGSTEAATLQPYTSDAGAHTHTITVNDAGGGEAHPNLQPSIVVPFFIKL